MRSASLGLKLGYNLVSELFYENLIVDEDTKTPYFKDILQKYKEDRLRILSSDISSFEFSKHSNEELFTYQFEKWKGNTWIR